MKGCRNLQVPPWCSSGSKEPYFTQTTVPSEGLREYTSRNSLVPAGHYCQPQFSWTMFSTCLVMSLPRWRSRHVGEILMQLHNLLCAHSQGRRQAWPHRCLVRSFSLVEDWGLSHSGHSFRLMLGSCTPCQTNLKVFRHALRTHSFQQQRSNPWLHVRQQPCFVDTFPGVLRPAEAKKKWLSCWVSNSIENKYKCLRQDWGTHSFHVSISASLFRR